MALKKLVSDLTQGLIAYPNHNTPANVGGFNYGGSTSIFDTQVFNQRSIPYAKPMSRQDNPEPFIPQLLPGVNDEPGESIFYIDDSPDGFIRGGSINAQKRAAWDSIRINKFFLTGEGISFIENQHALQRTNPYTQEGGPGTPTGFIEDVLEGIFGAGMFGIAGTRSNINRTFNEQNLIKQIEDGGYTGLYYNRAGHNPTVQSETQNKYESVHKPGRQFDSNQIGSFNTYSGLSSGNRLLSLGNKLKVGSNTSFNLSTPNGGGSLMAQSAGFDLGTAADAFNNIQTSFNNFMSNPLEVLSNNNTDTIGFKPGENILYQYSGGPGSTYGIGDTILYRYERTSGNYDHQGHPLTIQQYFTDHPYSVANHNFVNNIGELVTGAINENFFGGNSIMGPNSIFRPDGGGPVTGESFISGLGNQIFGSDTIDFVSNLFNNNFPLGGSGTVTVEGSYNLGVGFQTIDGTKNQVDSTIKNALSEGPSNKYIGHTYTDKSGKGKTNKPDDIADKIEKKAANLPIGVGTVLNPTALLKKDGSIDPRYRPTLSQYVKDHVKYKGINNYSYYNTNKVHNASGINLTREQRVGAGNPGTKKWENGWDGKSVGLDRINALDIEEVKDGKFSAQKYRDFVRFRIEAIQTDNPSTSDTMVFRAFLDNFKDNYKANWNSFKYNGRGEEFYTYGGFKRTFSINFKVAAQSSAEMKPIYRKLNYLVSNTAPDYSNAGRMRAPYIKLSVGAYMDRTPGILTSVNISWNKNYPFEIAVQRPESRQKGSGPDKEMHVLPHVLDVSLQFTPIHDFVPRKSIEESPFILPGKGTKLGNPWLTGKDKEIKEKKVISDRQNFYDRIDMTSMGGEVTNMFNSIFNKGFNEGMNNGTFFPNGPLANSDNFIGPLQNNTLQTNTQNAMTQFQAAADNVLSNFYWPMTDAAVVLPNSQGQMVDFNGDGIMDGSITVSGTDAQNFNVTVDVFDMNQFPDVDTQAITEYMVNQIQNQ